MSTEQLDHDALVSLETRVNALHGKVFSKDISLTGDLNKPMEVLEQSQCTIKEMESRHAVISQLWKKLEKLEEYLETCFIDKIGLNDEVKTALIIANEDNLKTLSHHLKELTTLRNVVNNNSLKDIPQHSSKLAPILQLHFDQQDEALVLNSRVDSLLTAYNNIISTLSKQFMLWNNMVTQCELALEMEREVIE